MEDPNEVQEGKISKPVSIHFSLASFQARLESNMDKAAVNEQLLEAAESNLTNLKTELETKESMLKKIEEAVNNEHLQALSKIEQQKKEKSKLVESISNLQTQLSELNAKYEELLKVYKESTKEQKNVCLFKPPCSLNQVEFKMIDALAKQQVQLQTKLEMLEKMQEELIETSKTAQINHVELTSGQELLQNKMKQAVVVLNKLFASLEKERLYSKELEAKLHVIKQRETLDQLNRKNIEEKIPSKNEQESN